MPRDQGKLGRLNRILGVLGLLLRAQHGVLGSFWKAPPGAGYRNSEQALTTLDMKPPICLLTAAVRLFCVLAVAAQGPTNLKRDATLFNSGVGRPDAAFQHGSCLNALSVGDPGHALDSAPSSGLLLEHTCLSRLPIPSSELGS